MKGIIVTFCFDVLNNCNRPIIRRNDNLCEIVSFGPAEYFNHINSSIITACLIPDYFFGLSQWKGNLSVLSLELLVKPLFNASIRVVDSELVIVETDGTTRLLEWDSSSVLSFEQSLEDDRSTEISLNLAKESINFGFEFLLLPFLISLLFYKILSSCYDFIQFYNFFRIHSACSL